MRARIHGRIRSFKQVGAGFGSQRATTRHEEPLDRSRFPQTTNGGGGARSRAGLAGALQRRIPPLPIQSLLSRFSLFSLSDRMSFTSKEKSALEIEGIEEGSMGTDISPSAAQ